MTDLLALSDVLVIRALERSSMVGLDGSIRRALNDRGIAKHCSYQHIRVPPTRYHRIFEGTWSITRELVETWRLPIDAADWSAALDAYCRNLLATQRPRSLDDLAVALDRVGVRHAV